MSDSQSGSCEHSSQESFHSSSTNLSEAECVDCGKKFYPLKPKPYRCFDCRK